MEKNYLNIDNIINLNRKVKKLHKEKNQLIAFLASVGLKLKDESIKKEIVDFLNNKKFSNK
jgi:hypothetical protein